MLVQVLTQPASTRVTKDDGRSLFELLPRPALADVPGREVVGRCVAPQACLPERVTVPDLSG